MTFAIANADGVLNRKDIIVLRWDVNERSITVQVIQGTPASDPIAPSIVRSTEQYDLELAEISIPAGTTAITEELITDTRLNTDVCGIVHGVVQQVDTSTFFAQYQAWYTQTTGQAGTDIDAIKAQFQTDLAQFEQDWDTWFAAQQTEGFVMASEKGQPDGVATLGADGKVPDEQLPTMDSDNIDLTDPNGHFEATNVTGALDELFTSVSDGKSSVAGAITDKGVNTSPTDTFQQIADNIEAIETDPSIGTTDAVAADIRLNKKAVSQGVLTTGDMPDNGSQSATLEITGSAKPTKTIPAGYTSGGTVTAQLAAGLANSIINTANIGGVQGTAVPFRSASGSVAPASSVTISGLSFQPKFIYVKYSLFQGGSSNHIVGSLYITGSYQYGITLYKVGTGSPSVHSTDVFTINSDGFSCEIDDTSDLIADLIADGEVINWDAWG